MSQKSVPVNGELCVWMSAGLLTYKLCDRDFDCDHCPLDAALRGKSGRKAEGERRKLEELSSGMWRVHRNSVPVSGPASRDMLFPSDRLYSTGHTWIQRSPDAGDTFRLGVDSFAAAVMAYAEEVSWGYERVCNKGEVVCRVDLGLGILPLRTPISGKVRQENQSLSSEPELMVSEPYSDGWLLEFDSTDETDFEQLVPPETAQARTELDLQRFRRRVAHGLLADAESVGPTLPDGGELITDLRQMLGGSRYLEILRELVH